MSVIHNLTIKYGTAEGQKVTRDVPSATLVLDLIAGISNRFNSSINVTDLIATLERVSGVGTELQPCQSLGAQNVGDNDVILVVPRIRGGGFSHFFAPDVRKQSSHSTTSEGPEYHYLTRGLNYGGICPSKRCQAKGELVVHQRGFGIFRPNEDESSLIITCPLCDTAFSPTKFYLFHCKAEIEFALIINKRVQPKEKVKFNIAAGKYKEFGDDEDGKANYASLIITAEAN